MSFKTVAVTWNDRRIDAPAFNAVKVALWADQGTDQDVNTALAYAATEARRSGAPYRVHTFDCADLEWRTKAAQAHAAGHSL